MVAFRIIFSYRSYNKEILREYRTNGRPFVVVANHLSMLDPIFIVMAYGWGPKFSIMGKAELFRNPVLAWFFRQIGGSPVERGTGDTAALDKAIEDVKNGQGMMIFPEGTRGTGDKMLRMKSGAFMVAARTGADIVPVRLIYPTSTRKLKFFAPVVVKVGQPLLAEDLNMVEGGKRALRAAKTKTQESLDNLLAEYNEMVGYVPPVIEDTKPETKVESEDESN
jgi:1-acyl-sn-glycerol-3-phosphate acyltransferase